MTGRNAAEGNQILDWDDAGKLVSVTGGASGTNTFIHDADGNVLLQKESARTTLYLPGQQLTLNTTTGAIDGDRYHALPGGGTCIRSGTGTNYTFALADHQGTPTIYLDNTAQTPTWRQYTPYGAPRGAAATYPDNRGFLNKPMSPTGLTTIGARAYDPVIGRFISVDPVIDTADPQQWNPYAYGHNSPIHWSDPTGMRDCADDDCTTYATPTPDGGKTIHEPGGKKSKDKGGKLRKSIDAGALLAKFFANQGGRLFVYRWRFFC